MWDRYNLRLFANKNSNIWNYKNTMLFDPSSEQLPIYMVKLSLCCVLSHWSWHKIVTILRISITISRKFAPGGQINNMPALVQIMAWCWSGDKPLSEPMLVSLLMQICITWLQWVKEIGHNVFLIFLKQTLHMSGGPLYRHKNLGGLRLAHKTSDF